MWETGHTCVTSVWAYVGEKRGLMCVHVYEKGQLLYDCVCWEEQKRRTDACEKKNERNDREK